MSNLAPWISFSPNYLSDQVTAAKATYTSSKSSSKTTTTPPPPYNRYGCGPLYNALAGGWDFLGSTKRTPDLYHQADYHTGKPLPPLLRDTRERVHCSVRARVRFGGLGIDNKTPYKSKGLANWMMQRGTPRNDSLTPNGHGPDGTGKASSVEWVYVGNDKDGQGKVLKEDELGAFEIELMRLVDPNAEAELFGS